MLREVGRDNEAFVAVRLLVELPAVKRPVDPFIQHLEAQGYEAIAWQYEQCVDRHGYLITHLRARPRA